MGRKRDYRRWDYEDENDLSLEEQLTLGDHYERPDTPTLPTNGTNNMISANNSTTTFSSSNGSLLPSSQWHIRHHPSKRGVVATVCHRSHFKSKVS